MTQEPTTKVCPICAQVINAPAKLCPFCRSPQGSWAFLSWHNPLISVLFVLLVVAVPLSFLLTMRQGLLGTDEDFALYRDELKVVESSFHLQDGKSALELSVVGILTNASSLSWRDVQVEAQLFDAGGKLIDSITDSQYHNTVLPHGVISFRLLSKPAREKAEYASHKVTVRFAKDGSGRW